MQAYIIIVPITLLISLIGLGLFIWQMKNNQYEDPEGSAARAIFDDETDKIG